MGDRGRPHRDRGRSPNALTRRTAVAASGSDEQAAASPHAALGRATAWTDFAFPSRETKRPGP